MTRNGHEALKEKLRQLKKVDRPDVIRAIEEARAHGDISENAEFEAAKERQAFIEGKIGELQYKIGCAEVIDSSELETDRVVFGNIVALEDYGSEKRVKYQIVGSDEADVGQGHISVASPLGKALIGKKVGNAIVVQTPGGQRRYELLAISTS